MERQCEFASERSGQPIAQRYSAGLKWSHEACARPSQRHNARV